MFGLGGTSKFTKFLVMADKQLWKDRGLCVTY